MSARSATEFDVSYLRTAIDFVTRRWIRCPVESRSDWLDMRAALRPRRSGAPSGDAAARARRLAARGWMRQLDFSGPFWQLREWLGFEKLCMLFYDDLPFLRRDDRVLGDVRGAGARADAFATFVPDVVHLSEDMAYKGFSMISPAMVREFLLPVWTAVGRDHPRRRLPGVRDGLRRLRRRAHPALDRGRHQRCDPSRWRRATTSSRSGGGSAGAWPTGAASTSGPWPRAARRSRREMEPGGP